LCQTSAIPAGDSGLNSVEPELKYQVFLREPTDKVLFKKGRIEVDFRYKSTKEVILSASVLKVSSPAAISVVITRCFFLLLI